MIVAAHQLHYLPWVRYFAKALQSHCFILLDDVQYAKGGYQNRNWIKGSNGRVRLTVPVRHRLGERLLDVRIAFDGGEWRERHWRGIQTCYGQAPHFRKHRHFFEEFYATPWETLVPMSEALIRYLLDAFGIRRQVVRSSLLEIPFVEDPTERLILLVRKLGGTAYLSGAHGAGMYLDSARMEAAGIRVQVQEWTCPEYRQQFPDAGFIPDLAAVDLLLNEGDQSLEILRKGARLADARPPLQAHPEPR